MNNYKPIPFNKLTPVGNELNYIQQAALSDKLSGDGLFNKKCVEILKEIYGSHFINLTPSCTSALEMAYLLIDLKPGDEVILPSFTFTSTATAITIFGAIPVFVDIDSSFNIDIDKALAAITNKTKAICLVHYAGQSCNIEKIKAAIQNRNIYIIEDAAQSIGAKYKQEPLGVSGDISCFSFHETKNVGCGEGGAILINNKNLVARAEIIKDKGTNRQKFFRGEVDKYSWQDKGSSYLLGELSAAYLLAQLEKIEIITKKRIALFERYYSNLSNPNLSNIFSLPQINKDNEHNGHIFYILLKQENLRPKIIERMRNMNIVTSSHYVPLHSSKAGLVLGRSEGDLNFTNTNSNRLLRLPIYYTLNIQEVDFVCELLIQNLLDLSS